MDEDLRCRNEKGFEMKRVFVQECSQGLRLRDEQRGITMEVNEEDEDVEAEVDQDAEVKTGEDIRWQERNEIGDEERYCAGMQSMTVTEG